MEQNKLTKYGVKNLSRFRWYTEHIIPTPISENKTERKAFPVTM
jgi:hypothetical protein